MSISILLPWPPSLNRYYRNVSGVMKISADGRAYRQQVIRKAFECGKTSFGAGAVAVDITAHFPDRRRRDLDNLLKGLLDALTHAGFWLDDSQIVDLRIRKAPEVVKGGLIALEVRAVE